jgi:casein kinase II subunit beta
MLFMVYPQMIPSKNAPLQTAGVGGGVGGAPGAVGGGVGGGGGGTGPVGAIGQTGIGAAQAYMREGPTAVGVGSVSTAASAMKAEVYDPRLFGFRVNETAKLKRWREAMRDK